MVRAVLFTFLLGGWASVSAQLSLTCKVSDGLTDEPVAGVEITTAQHVVYAVTANNGTALLKLPPGEYHFHFTKAYYQTAHLQLRILHDTVLSIKLFPTAIQLREVHVEDRLLQDLNRKVSVDVASMDARSLAQTGAINFADALAQLPGLQTLSTGVGISKPVIRGLTGNRVLVMDNGVRQEGQQWGLDHGLEIDAFRVQRVNVIKGPAAIQYGSDATGGVIEILPEPVPEKGMHGTLSGLVNSNNYTRAVSAGITYRKNAWYGVGRVTWQRYQDYHVPATAFTYNGFVLPIRDNRLLNTGGQGHNLHALIGKRWLRGNTYVSFTHFNQLAGLFPGAIGIPRYNDLNRPWPDGTLRLPMQYVRHTRFIGHTNLQFKRGWLELDIGHQRNHRQELSPPHSHGYELLAPGDSLALQMILQTNTLRATYHTHLAKRVELNAGINAQTQKNAISGFEYLVPNYTFWQAGGFAFARSEITKTAVLSLGIRLDGAEIAARKHEQPWYKNPDSLVVRTPQIERTFLNWSAAGGVNFNPSETWAFKINYARTFRIPSVAELGANGVHHGTFRHEVGNANLNPERAHQFDAGFNVTLPKLTINGNAFFNYFNAVIYLAASGQFSPLPDAGQVYIYTQDQAIHTGFELYAAYNPFAQVVLESTTEYVYTQTIANQSALPFMPPFMQQLKATYKGPKKYQWHVGITAVLAAAQNLTDRNEPATPGYAIWHFNAGYTFNLAKTQLVLNLIGMNMSNTSYLNNMSRYRILNLPEQGRNIMLQLRYEF